MVEKGSERVLAGTLLQDPSKAALIRAAGVGEDHFEVSVYRRIVSIAFDLVMNGTASRVVIMDLVKDLDEVKNTPHDFITNLLADGWVDDDSAITFHSNRLREAKVARDGYLLMEEALSDMDGKEDSKERAGVVDATLKQLLTSFSLSPSTSKKAPEISEDFLERFYSKDKSSTRLKTGFPSIDAIIGGLMIPRVCVIAGHTNHGKSLLTDLIALNACLSWKAKGENKQVVKFSCEDDLEANAMRWITSIANTLGTRKNKVTAHQVTAHLDGDEDLDEESARTIDWAAKKFAGLSLTIDEHSSPDRGYVMSRLMECDVDCPVGLVIFDYLEFTGEVAATKTQAIDQTMLVLHELSKRYGCPTIAVSQLKESSLERNNGVPTLADLSWSSFIKKIAAQVMMVHSPYEHWLQTGQAYDRPEEHEYDVYIRKSKGRRGGAPLNMYPDYLTILDNVSSISEVPF